jgi:hypothetical protein
MASRHNLINGVKKQSPLPRDIVMVSDIDEIPMPSAVRDLIEHPPQTYKMLRAHYFFYSLRYEGRSVWIRNGVVR